MSTIKVHDTFLMHPVSRKNKVNVGTFNLQPNVVELQRLPLSGNGSSSSIQQFRYSEGFENLIVLFFKLSYFLGITPYYWKIKNNESGTRAVEVASNMFHTVIVCTVHICAALRFSMRFSLLSYDLKNPVNYFKVARVCMSSSLCCCFLWSLWRRQNVCNQLLLQLTNLPFFPNVTHLWRKWVIYPLLVISLGLLCSTSLFRAMDECASRWEVIFCENNESGQESFCRSDKYLMWRGVVKVLFSIFNYFGRMTRRLPRMELLVIALTMWQVCKSFAKYLKRRSLQRSNYQNHEINTVLMAYEELKSISNLIRDLVGEMLVSEIVEDIVYFSLEVQLRLRELSDFFSIFVVFETWLVAFLAYFVAACASEHIQEVSVWLARDDVLSKLSPGKVTTLHSQLAANPIGMKGGSLFTLTKGFLANVSSFTLMVFLFSQSAGRNRMGNVFHHLVAISSGRARNPIDSSRIFSIHIH